MTTSKLSNRQKFSLSQRVTFFVAIAITLSMVLIGYLVQSSIERHFEEQDAEELVVITHAVKAALEKANLDGNSIGDVLGEAVSGHHGVYYQVHDEEGTLIYGSADANSSEPILSTDVLTEIQSGNLYLWEIDKKTYRGTITQTQVGGDQYRIIAMIDMDFHIHFLEDFRNTLWGIMVLAGFVTLLAAWYSVHRGHAPLRALSEAMEDAQADRLDVRLDTDKAPAEVISLVESFNHMMGRLEESFIKLSHFSADIAHELRTPLTNIITQTQVGLAKSRSLDEYKELLYSNLEEQERLTKMVNDMLWLAQNENGLLDPNWEKLDLAQEVKATCEFFEALAEEKGVLLRVEGNGGTVTGDRVMMRRVLSNLLSNALRFTPNGEAITFKVSETESKVDLIVENPGPDIPSEHLPRLFDRFYRADPSRKRDSEGAGLGLAIVKSIVEAHGGAIDVKSERGVTSFSMSFYKQAN